MKLVTKLFLFVGILLLVVCVAIYFVPIYVATQQGDADRAAYDARLDKQRDEEWNNVYDWITGEFSSIEGTIDAFLVLTANNPQMLPFFKEPQTVWYSAIQLFRYASEINFLQINLEEIVAVIALDNVNHYWAHEDPINDHLSWVTFSTRRWRDPITWAVPYELPPEILEIVFMGIRHPTDAEGSEVFLLFNPFFLYRNPELYKDILAEEKLKPFMERFLKDLVSAGDFLHSKFTDERSLTRFTSRQKAKVRLIKTLYPVEWGAIGTETGVKGEDIQKMAERRLLMRFFESKMRERVIEMSSAMALYTTGSVWKTPLDLSAAVGAAFIDTNGNQGGGQFGRSVFLTESVFDEELLLKTYPPRDESVPISTGFGLVSKKGIGYETVVNTLILPPPHDFFTAGITIEKMQLDLQEITGKTVVLMADGQPVTWAGYAYQDVMPEQVFLDEVEKKASTFTKKTGFTEIGSERFYYSAYQPRKEWDLVFLTFDLAAKVEAPYQLYQKRSEDLMQKVALFSLLFALSIFILALGILLIIARRFTKPITRLAEAAHYVAEEKYEKIKLPQVPRSGNEVFVLTHAFHGMIKGLHDRAKIRDALDKVVSKEIAKEILKGEVKLGGAVKYMAVLFADIHNFGTVSEKFSPEQVVIFTNAYLNEMTKIIEQNRGVIDKYIGQEVMALFGAPLMLKRSPLRSVIAALIMRNSLRNWDTSIDFGIGINCGDMIAGNVGAQERLNYTVMGANVNLAARLCQEAKGGEILVPESMTEIPILVEHIRFEMRSAIRFKGFSKPINIYRVIGAKPPHTIQSLIDMTGV